MGPVVESQFMPPTACTQQTDMCDTCHTQVCRMSHSDSRGVSASMMQSTGMRCFIPLASLLCSLDRRAAHATAYQEQLKHETSHFFSKTCASFGSCFFSAMPKSSNNLNSTAAAATAARRTIAKNSCSSVLQRVKSFADIKKRGAFKSPSEVHRTI